MDEKQTEVKTEEKAIVKTYQNAEALKAQQWKKGQSGNPHGAPKKELRFTNAIREALAEKNKTGDATKMQELIQVLYEQGMAGNVKAIEILIERMDGKAIQQLEVTRKEEYVLSWGDEQEEEEEDFVEGEIKDEKENSS